MHIELSNSWKWIQARLSKCMKCSSSRCSLFVKVRFYERCRVQQITWGATNRFLISIWWRLKKKCSAIHGWKGAKLNADKSIFRYLEYGGPEWWKGKVLAKHANTLLGTWFLRAVCNIFDGWLLSLLQYCIQRVQIILF